MKSMLALLAIALLASGCAAKTDKVHTGAALNVSAAFAPDPPKQGPETITVTVTDASGAPVKGADVKISSAMPAMSMTAPTVSGSDNGDGTYTAHLKLNYATRWNFGISATAGANKASAIVSKDVP